MTAPLDRSELGALLSFWRSRPGVSFSVGAPGVVAEFCAPDNEPVVWNHTDGIMTGTCRGGLLEITLADNVLGLPFDVAGRKGNRRIRGYLFCLARRHATTACHRVLRRVGADVFDIGAGVGNVDALVVVDDPALCRTLTQAEGQRLVGTHHPALAAIVEASPPRLFRSRLARITVTAPIATSVTPEGPHTHLLADLIDGSTHDARIEVPDGWLPCLTLHVPEGDPAFP